MLDRDWDLDNQSPFMGFAFSDMKFMVDEEDFPVNQQLIDNFLRNEGRRTPFEVTRSDLTPATEFRINPYGVFNGFNTRGTGGVFNYNEEKQKQLRATVDWQVNRQNRLKFGGDYTDIQTDYVVTGYQSLSFAQMWLQNPKRASLFAQDRLDLGDLVIEGGLRYDLFNPNSTFPITPGYINPDDPSTFEEAPVRSTLSPRLGVSFPVTVNSTFRLSCGLR